MAGKDVLSYITGQIRYICNTFVGRAAGTKAEYDCQQHFKEQLAGWADEVTEHKFTLHPHAFMGWMAVTGVLDVIAVACFWARMFSSSILFPILGVVCILTTLVTFLFEFVLYHRFVDFLFPKRSSLNIYARRKPEKECKRRIIFGGHADAAYEMTYSLHGDVKNIYRVIAGTLIGVIFLAGVNIALLIATLMNGYVPIEGVWTVLGIIGVLFVPFFIDSMFFTDWKRIVDGANDNLTGSLVAMSLLRDMQENGERLMHTEVCCLITGGEEAGLRGAKAFARECGEELRDVETIFVALDTLREVEHLQIYHRGINGTQRNSDEVGVLIKRAARKCGMRLRAAGIYPGATDAEAFSREGIKASALCGVNHIPQTYYHTRFDSLDNIDEACIQLTYDICKEMIRLYDGQ